ncbi:TRAP transporter small permease [Denitrificimonas sp. JX-1]|uniref:TRAP transporter small permease protein n=1 Tax=Denitrificimonas halotolerans TaxID=3098930 RepID=A0ABU5GPW9_9GAMM|nr:TRAP transporter small permease [Denitrificimonas sp. JX-1]MDY7219035.1 TRAP transporter small permease [Denitrificimonas sp. JX-1]
MDDSVKTDGNKERFKHNAFLRVLNSIDRGLGWVERTIIASSVLLMAILMSAHVVGNLLFNRGIPGTYEVTEMLIVIITFVGLGYAARHARHIRMSAVYDLLKGRVRKALLIVISVGSAALMFYLAYKSAQYDLALYVRGRTSSALHIPMWVINLALPAGFTLAGIQYSLTAIRNLISKDIYRTFREKEEYSEVPLESSDNHICLKGNSVHNKKHTTD